MGREWSNEMLKRFLAVAIAGFLLQSGIPPCGLGAGASRPASKVKLRGYITARIDAQTVAILDDHIHFNTDGHITLHESGGDRTINSGDLAPGMLIEAEGVWTGRHQFASEKISVDAGFLEKEIHDSAYLQEEPAEAAKIAGGELAELKADGEWLLLGTRTKREWAAPPAIVEASVTGAPPSGPQPPDTPLAGGLAGHRLSYTGVRGPDGKITAARIELGPPAPADAYKMPHGIQVAPAKDPQTGIDIIEFRRGKKVDGRMKLFPVPEVQKYVSRLGDSLLPAGAKGTTKALEFRFFVVEDASINAEALPDGTVIVDTALLATVENEAQLAFVLSHEISHVLQAHSWREVHETRPQRIGLLIAGLAAGYFIGDLGIFLADLGMASVVNGHQRELENQADRLGLQNIIEHGYDPRSAPNFMKIIVEHYGNRSTSKIWSNHDSSVLRGSFLTVQMMKQYPDRHFDGKRVSSEAFDAMREAMGPVKVE